MKRKLFLSLCGVVAVAGCWRFSGVAVSDDQLAQQAAPMYESKIFIETPAEKLVETALRSLPPKEASPAKDPIVRHNGSRMATLGPALSGRSAQLTANSTTITANSKTTKDRRPLAAEPGKVDWHADFAAACQAGRESGKPVLLFQLMGRLDEVFC